MSDAMPSRKLLVMLALSLVLASFTVGRSYLAGSDEPGDEIFDLYDPDDRVGTERVVLDDWELPELPRDPFLQLDIGGTVPP